MMNVEASSDEFVAELFKICGYRICGNSVRSYSSAVGLGSLIR